MNARRRHGAAALAAFAIGATAVWGAGPAWAQSEPITVVATDVSRYPEVELTVAGPPQLAEEDLDALRFEVLEGGQPRPVVVEALPAEPLELVLVIDTSGSMRGAPLHEAKAASRSFLTQLPASAAVTVLGFGAAPAEVSGRSTDREAQLLAVDGLGAGGETALYDALILALSRLPGGEGTRQVVVVLSDGGDTASAATLEATADALGASGASLFAVDLRTPESRPDALAALASATAGQVIAADDPGALAAAFDGIAGQLIRHFAVTWPSQLRGTTDVEIVLEAPGMRATARQRLELPAGPPGRALAGTAAGPGSVPAASTIWALVGGVAMVSAAILVLALMVLAFRPPRARGVDLRPGRFGLAGTAARAEKLGEGVLGRRGRALALGSSLDAAGLDIRPGEVVVVVAAASTVALVGGWLLASLVVGVMLALVVPVAAGAALKHLAQRRRNRFTDQLSETLQMLAGSLRAGHGLAQSIDTVGREADAPTAEEFRRLTVETRLGRDLNEALGGLAARMRSADFEWVVQAVAIHREVGGDLAEILDSVAGTIGDRNRLRRQVSALTAEGRLSGWVLMVIPFAVAAMMVLTNPAYLDVLFTTTKGLVLLAFGAVLMTAGGAWLRRIARPVF